MWLCGQRIYTRWRWPHAWPVLLNVIYVYLKKIIQLLISLAEVIIEMLYISSLIIYSLFLCMYENCIHILLWFLFWICYWLFLFISFFTFVCVCVYGSQKITRGNLCSRWEGRLKLRSAGLEAESSRQPCHQLLKSLSLSSLVAFSWNSN